MEVKIGVQNTNRELVVDSSQSADEVEKAVAASLSGESKVLVPADKLAYVEIGTSHVGQVGYRS